MVAPRDRKNGYFPALRMSETSLQPVLWLLENQNQSVGRLSGSRKTKIRLSDEFPAPGTWKDSLTDVFPAPRKPKSDCRTSFRLPEHGKIVSPACFRLLENQNQTHRPLSDSRKMGSELDFPVSSVEKRRKWLKTTFPLPKCLLFPAGLDFWRRKRCKTTLIDIPRLESQALFYFRFGFWCFGWALEFFRQQRSSLAGHQRQLLAGLKRRRSGRR
ncbi:MAG: hypothetical protein JWM68_2874 [Verrucomicrobiales bacterium]|nr:hypothetical protein [Verrucomicrobiales bacterium]